MLYYNNFNQNAKFTVKQENAVHDSLFSLTVVFINN